MIFQRVWAISKKEFKQFYRDKLILISFFFLPVILIIILGYALNFDLYGVKTGILDKDQSLESRKLIAYFSHSKYFSLAGTFNKNEQIDEAFDRSNIRCAIVIPENFSVKINSGENVNIQVLVDGTEGSTATQISGYVRGAIMAFNREIAAEGLIKHGIKINPVVESRTVFMYNSDLKSTRFLIPGLIAIILTIVAVISIAMSIANEKETGTIAHLRISHVSFAEIILGKTLMYTTVISFVFILILAASYIFFGIFIKGSIVLLAASTLLFLFATLNLGIFISTIARTRQLAFQFATLISLTPSIVLSGFIFPIENMPFAIQVLSNMTPAKYFTVILRNIIIKGTGFVSVSPQIVSLLIFGSVFFMLSVFLNIRRTEQ